MTMENEDAGSIEGPAIAVTGSPNTVRQVSIDVRAEHLDAPLLGALVAFEMEVGGSFGGAARRAVMIVGQVSDAVTSNRWHEDPNFKDYIKLRGRLPHLTGEADVTTGVMQVLGSYELFEGSWRKANLSVPCRSGHAIRRVDAATIARLMENEDGFAYLGDFYGASGVPAPVMTRHFGKPGADRQGGGEALIGGVFGPSGSGKTVLGLSLATLWARHEGMGFLFLDPQGEMYQDKVSGDTDFPYEFHAQLARASAGRFRRNQDRYRIEQIRLEGVDLLLRILSQKQFFSHLGVGPSKAQQVVEALVPSFEELVADGKFRVGMSWADLDAVALRVPVVKEDEGDGGETPDFKTVHFKEWLCERVLGSYSEKGVVDKRKELKRKLTAAIVKKTWDEAAKLFANSPEKIDLKSVVTDVLCKGRIVILNLDLTLSGLDQTIKNEIVLLVLKAVGAVAGKAYHTKDAPQPNAMIVLDEAHLYIPQTSEDERVRAIAKDLAEKAKMLRKLSVGMMFMTQRITGVKSDVFAQMHYRIYGQGLSMGGDAEAVKQMEGNDAYRLYSELPAPRLCGKFSYMIAGSLIALGNTGQPMFIEGYKSGEALMKANSRLFRPYNPPPSSSAEVGRPRPSRPGRDDDMADLIAAVGDSITNKE
jgi:hypothetical protein